MNLDRILAPYSPPLTNLSDVLRYWSQQQPTQVALSVWDGERVGESWTYRELEQRAHAIAAELQSKKTKTQALQCA